MQVENCDMGIEEPERLIAEGIQLGLKGAELRVWVDNERCRLKRQREAESEKLQAECEEERLALKDAQEKELAELKHQLALLENLLERKAEDASLVMNMSPGHKKLEDIGQTSHELNVPRPDITESSSYERFRYDLKHDRKLLSGNYFGTEKLSSEFRSKIPHEKDDSTFHESGPLPVDDSVPPEVGLKVASAAGAAITYADTSLFAVSKVNEYLQKLLSSASVHPYTEGARTL